MLGFESSKSDPALFSAAALLGGKLGMHESTKRHYILERKSKGAFHAEVKDQQTVDMQKC